jgi:hypothetical protein
MEQERDTLVCSVMNHDIIAVMIFPFRGKCVPMVFDIHSNEPIICSVSAIASICYYSGDLES